MKFTLSWLNEHIKFNNSEIQVSELLTNLGLEVESLDSLNENFKNFLVCNINSSIEAFPAPETAWYVDTTILLIWSFLCKSFKDKTI